MNRKWRRIGQEGAEVGGEYGQGRRRGRVEGGAG